MSDSHASYGTDRRDIAQRTTGWATKLADLMVALRLTPNRISVGSVLFALFGAVALCLSAGATTDGVRAVWLLVAAACIPLRLLLNMLDGMLAVEKGMSTSTGDLFNEVPDRIADLVLLAAAGYATAGVWFAVGIDWGIALGWAAAAVAILTAYVRSLGVTHGVGNFFDGPMAKPARMWVLVVACLLSLTEPLFAERGLILALGLTVICVGAVLTVVNRLHKIATALHARGAAQ